MGIKRRTHGGGVLIAVTKSGRGADEAEFSSSFNIWPGTVQ